jgi:hypothetical protein
MKPSLSASWFSRSSVLAFVVVIAGGGCSSSKSTECDTSQCAPGNECINDGKETKCRLPCAAHTDCPANYFCGISSPKNFCMPTTLTIAPKPGQWGTSCLPSGGFDQNPACDSADGFACYGTGKSDANAYCTLYSCATDADCAGGYWCATIDERPNVVSEKRSFGKTLTVCLKHSYCSPCTSDIDCPVIDGKPSRCLGDTNGGTYCATVCTDRSNCPLDALCAAVPDDANKYCTPRAGACVGDGSLCAPCRSDADCPNGFCIRAAYSTEKFCSVKANSTCAPAGEGELVKGDCPAFTGATGTKIGCESTSSNPAIPKDQCVGIIDFGDTGDIACYSKH